MEYTKKVLSCLASSCSSMLSLTPLVFLCRCSRRNCECASKYSTSALCNYISCQTYENASRQALSNSHCSSSFANVGCYAHDDTHGAGKRDTSRKSSNATGHSEAEGQSHADTHLNTANTLHHEHSPANILLSTKEQAPTFPCHNRHSEWHWRCNASPGHWTVVATEIPDAFWKGEEVSKWCPSLAACEDQ